MSMYVSIVSLVSSTQGVSKPSISPQPPGSSCAGRACSSAGTGGVLGRARSATESSTVSMLPTREIAVNVDNFKYLLKLIFQNFRFMQTF